LRLRGCPFAPTPGVRGEDVPSRARTNDVCRCGTLAVASGQSSGSILGSGHSVHDQLVGKSILDAYSNPVTCVDPPGRTRSPLRLRLSGGG
jgi:hypothetical protein